MTTFILLGLLLIYTRAYDATNCIFNNNIAPLPEFYGNNSKGVAFNDAQNLTYYQGDGHQLFLKTLVMCSDTSNALIGIRTNFVELSTVNRTII